MAIGGSGGLQSKAYKADPHEARTDLLFEGLGLAKIIVGAGLYVGLMVLLPSVPFWLVLMLIVGLVLFACFGLELVRRAVVQARGRTDARTIAQVAGDAVPLTFLPYTIYPVISSFGMPFWLNMLVGVPLIVALMRIVERIERRLGRHPPPA